MFSIDAGTVFTSYFAFTLGSVILKLFFVVEITGFSEAPSYASRIL